MRAQGRGDLDPAMFVRADGVHSAVYTDPDIFAEEMRRIYESTWVYVGHASEIPERGDYRSTWIGLQPVIMARGDDGLVRVMLNRCRHRGATICQDDAGNSSFFRCHYHGWTYRNNGELAGVTLPDGYDRCGFDVKSLSLLGAARCEDYRGFVFASLSDDVADLTEHLGPVTDYIDRFLDTGTGAELQVRRVVRHRYRFKANWKLQMENTVDGYHPGFTHRSFFDLMATQTGKKANPYFKRGASPIRSKAFRNGHSALDFGAGRSAEEFGDTFYERVREAPGAADILADFEAEMGSDVARKHLNRLIATGLNVAIFPNLGLIQSQIRVIRPIAADETEVTLYATELAGVDPRVNYLRRRAQEVFFGPAGLGGPDDVEMFRRCQSGLNASSVGWTVLARGFDPDTPETEGSEGDFAAENAQRGQYREWLRLMEAPAATEEQP